MPDWFWPTAIIPLCVIGWIVFSYLLASMSGWRKLAEIYPATQPFSGRWMRPWAASMGWGVNYNGLLNIGPDAAGIHISIFFLFRPGHPPLFIPFEEITATEARIWRTKWLSMARLQFARPSSAYLLIPMKTAEALSQASGLQLRIEQAE